jgi:predicted NodU family carbamoyl transferase
MYTLGINAAYHDSSACLVKDGQVIAAAEEERFTHVKHGKRPIPFSAYELPFHAIDYCLREGGIKLINIDHIAYSYSWFAHASASPFMLFVYDVLLEKADLIPAVRHVDGTARIQTINRQQHPLYYDLLQAFQCRTGIPVLISTSFNTRSEPIVCAPRDAIECFWTSPLGALVIGSFLLEKARDSQ